MGFLGSITGWDQQKAAHNAVLGSYLAETASAELKKAIVERLVIIQQQVARGGDSTQVLNALNRRSRVIQANFIALACNNLGIPGPHGLVFYDVVNPYRCESDSSLSRIEVAVADLSRRAKRAISWPGNEIKIDFASWNESPRERSPAEPIPPSSPSESPSQANVADPMEATNLAHHVLLSEAFAKEAVAKFVREAISLRQADSAYDLALAAAISILTHKSLLPHSGSLRNEARAKVQQWRWEGKIQPGRASYFETALSN